MYGRRGVAYRKYGAISVLLELTQVASSKELAQRDGQTDTKQVWSESVLRSGLDPALASGLSWPWPGQISWVALRAYLI